MTEFDEQRARAYLLLQGYNRQEAAARYKQLISTSETQDAFLHWACAYCHGADYNMYGPVYEMLRETRDWPSLEMARMHAQLAIELASANDPWIPVYKATAKRFKTLSIEQYVKSLDEMAESSVDCGVIAVHAEAHMLLEPWSLWDPSMKTRTVNAEVVQRLLDKGLRICPTHPWLCHLKVHYCEMGPPSQFDMNVLPPLEQSPNGHLRHMPSHIYIQTGEYEKSMTLNQEAVELDARDRESSVSNLALYCFYECHNLHFVVFAACMCGKRDVATTYARRLSDFVDARLRESPDDESIPHVMCEAFYMVEPMAWIRFGAWSEILSASPRNSRTSRLFYAYARGIAHAAMGQVAEAKTEAQAFDAILAKVPSAQRLHNETVRNICQVARSMLSAEIAYREDPSSDLFLHLLDDAIAKEDKLAYDEPPGWMMPVRQTAGALLNEQKRYIEAVSYVSRDLVLWPKNVWSLAALSNALPQYHAIVKRENASVQSGTDAPITAACACATTQWTASKKEDDNDTNMPIQPSYVHSGVGRIISRPSTLIILCVLLIALYRVR